MDRDPKTGQFIRNNKASVGNRGNRHPKWGNQNAVKHGLYSTGCFIDNNGRLVITNGTGIAVFEPGTFEMYLEGESVGNTIEDQKSLSGKIVEIFVFER